MYLEKKQLIADLKRIGISKGDHVALALSFKSMGHIKGGPMAFLESLLSIIGPEGTLMLNTFTNLFDLSKISKDYIFNLDTTKPNTGLVPLTFLKMKGVIRSRHPALSVAAVGKYAHYLTENHLNSDLYLPYKKLAKINGKFLFIGINDRLVGVRHEAQRRAGLWIVPMYKGVYYLTSEGKVKLFVLKMPPCVTALPKLVPTLEKGKKISRSKIGDADSILALAKELIESMTELLKNQPALNLCDDMLCLNCRELERRLDLYDKLPNPQLFHKSFLLRKLITLRNKSILRRNHNILRRHYQIANYKEPSKIDRGLYVIIEFVLTAILRVIKKILR